jgi:hypothetical protein
MLNRIYFDEEPKDLSISNNDEFLLISSKNKVVVRDLSLRTIKEIEFEDSLIIYSAVYLKRGIYATTSQGLGIFRNNLVEHSIDTS